MLRNLGHNVKRLHGDRTQSQRTKAIEGFRAGKFRILVATDIAARGIDIPHIEHVINYEKLRTQNCFFADCAGINLPEGPLFRSAVCEKA